MGEERAGKMEGKRAGKKGGGKKEGKKKEQGNGKAKRREKRTGKDPHDGLSLARPEGIVSQTSQSFQDFLRRICGIQEEKFGIFFFKDFFFFFFPLMDLPWDLPGTVPSGFGG